jgi:CRISPR-associated protein Csm4
MKAARFRLRPLGPWGTPWQADSLFGALCWELLRAADEAGLERLLQRYRQGSPPFLLSDAFPADLLPRPLCATLPTGSPDVRLLTREQFVAARNGEHVEGGLPRQQWWSVSRGVRAAMPRDGGDPQLFGTEEYFWRPDVPDEQRFVSLYVRADEEWLPKIAVLLRALGRSGFGRRRSLGRGAFELLGPAEPAEWLEPLPFENAFVSLSHFVPEDSDPADGVWDVLVKYPRLGWVRGDSSRPYKGRVLMLTPGSCFRPAGRPRRWYGRMIAGLAPAFPEALHYALSFAVGLRWDVRH